MAGGTSSEHSGSQSAGRAPRATASPAPGRRAVSLVPAGGRFEGLLAARGELRLDGEHHGPVRAEGLLSIGREGRVVGDVEVDELQVAGVLVGRATARCRAVLEEGATVSGTLSAPSLVMREGAVLEGDCKAGEAD